MGQILPFPSRPKPDTRRDLSFAHSWLSTEANKMACNLLCCRAVLVQSRVLPEAQDDLQRTADTARRLDERLSLLRENLAGEETPRLAALMLEMLGELDALKQEASRTMARITARREAWTAVLA